MEWLRIVARSRQIFRLRNHRRNDNLIFLLSSEVSVNGITNSSIFRGAARLRIGMPGALLRPFRETQSRGSFSPSVGTALATSRRRPLSNVAVNLALRRRARKICEFPERNTAIPVRARVPGSADHTRGSGAHLRWRRESPQDQIGEGRSSRSMALSRTISEMWSVPFSRVSGQLFPLLGAGLSSRVGPDTHRELCGYRATAGGQAHANYTFARASMWNRLLIQPKPAWRMKDIN